MEYKTFDDLVSQRYAVTYREDALATIDFKKVPAISIRVTEIPKLGDPAEAEFMVSIKTEGQSLIAMVGFPVHMEVSDCNGKHHRFIASLIASTCASYGMMYIFSAEEMTNDHNHD